MRCRRCHGSGEVWHPRHYGDPEQVIMCPDCDGYGDEGPRGCDDCGDTANPAEPTGETRYGRVVYRCRRCTDNLHRDEVA